MSDVTFTAKRLDTGKMLPLRSAWVEGGNDEVSFSMECGAGFGSSIMCITVKTRGVTVTELIDVRDGLTAWVSRIVDEIEAELAS